MLKRLATDLQFSRMTAMVNGSIKLFHFDKIHLDTGLLRQVSEDVEVQPFSSIDDCPRPVGPAIYVVTASQAASILGDNKLDIIQNNRVLVIAKETDESIADELLQSDRIAGVIDATCSRETLFTTFKSAIALLDQLQQQNAAQMLEDILEIGLALMQEKNLDTLLGLILTYARKLTGADGASIYTRDKDGALYFRLWQNESTDIVANAQKTLVGDYSIAGQVTRTGKMLVIDDAYKIPDSEPYKFNPASDKSIGYHTQSVLTTPLSNKRDEIVGVLQLVNKKTERTAALKTEADCNNYVVPFDQQDRLVAQALAGQAGVALENSMLYSDIEHLFEGFIRASVQAIEARDPTTAGHSFRVAEFTNRLARAVDRSDEFGLRNTSFSNDELKELRYAALLHDFGKVGVREDVLVKANKLYPHELEIIKHKFRYARSSVERQSFREMLELYETDGSTRETLMENRRRIQAAIDDELSRLDQFLDLVLKANEPSVSHQEVSRELDAIAAYSFRGENNELVKLLDEFEFTGLTVSKGSLTEDERKEIESHVSHTFSFLSLIPWTRNLANLPDIAHGHHEKLDGTGYPLGLKGDEVCPQTRIMTISDIYDALTASDRPYKRALPMDRALDILGYEAEGGKVDEKILKVFIESGAYTLDVKAS